VDEVRGEGEEDLLAVGLAENLVIAIADVGGLRKVG